MPPLRGTSCDPRAPCPLFYSRDTASGRSCRFVCGVAPEPERAVPPETRLSRAFTRGDRTHAVLAVPRSLHGPDEAPAPDTRNGPSALPAAIVRPCRWMALGSGGRWGGSWEPALATVAATPALDPLRSRVSACCPCRLSPAAKRALWKFDGDRSGSWAGCASRSRLGLSPGENQRARGEMCGRCVARRKQLGGCGTPQARSLPALADNEPHGFWLVEELRGRGKMGSGGGPYAAHTNTSSGQLVGCDGTMPRAPRVRSQQILARTR